MFSRGRKVCHDGRLSLSVIIYSLYSQSSEQLDILLPQAGQKTVTVSGKALTLLEDNYKQRGIRPNLSFATFISESALIELERRKILREAQFISLVGFGDDAVYP